MTTVLTVARPRRNIELVLLLAAMAAVAFAAVDLDLATSGHVSTASAELTGVLGALVIGLHLALRRRARYADPMILPIATVLNGVGLVMIRRLDLASTAGSSVSGRQLIWTAAGCPCRCGGADPGP